MRTDTENDYYAEVEDETARLLRDGFGYPKVCVARAHRNVQKRRRAKAAGGGAGAKGGILRSIQAVLRNYGWHP